MRDSLRALPPVASSGRAHYPEDPFGDLRALGYAAWSVDASGIAVALGDVRLANTVMLGAAADSLPFESDGLLAQILQRFSGNDQLRRRNAAAFEAGRAQTRADSSGGEPHASRVVLID